jgi:hypothetical protein
LRGGSTCDGIDEDEPRAAGSGRDTQAKPTGEHFAGKLIGESAVEVEGKAALGTDVDNATFE